MEEGLLFFILSTFFEDTLKYKYRFLIEYMVEQSKQLFLYFCKINCYDNNQCMKKRINFSNNGKEPNGCGRK